jgi:hypothetical protein
MVDMSSKAAQFDTMLAQRQAQTEGTGPDPRPSSLDTSPSTPAINTPGATQELFGFPYQDAAPGSIDPLLLAEEHQF